MKILQIIDSLNTGGAEKLILDTVPLYIKKGLEMDVLVLKDEDYPFMQKLAQMDVCKIYKLGSGSVYNPFHIFRIAKIIKDYDIVHVHLFPAQYWAALASILIEKNIPLIFTEHNTTNTRMQHKSLSIIDKLIYKFYQKIICISPEIQEILINHTGFAKSRLPIIENGINTNLYIDAKAYEKTKISNKISATDILIMQIAAFRKQKDQKTLISSLKFLPTKFKVILVGDGPLRTELEKFTQSNNLHDRVIFLGRRNDVPKLLKTADYVVLSSKYEGLSLSSIEGMASGKPFIASDVPGLTEIVKGYGKLFPVGDAQALADIIRELNNNPVLQQQIIKNSLKRAHEFDIEKMVDKHINLYKKMFEKTRTCK